MYIPPLILTFVSYALLVEVLVAGCKASKREQTPCDSLRSSLQIQWWGNTTFTHGLSSHFRRCLLLRLVAIC